MTTMTRILMITTVIVSSMTTVVATIIIVVTCSFYGASLPYSQLSKVTT